MTAEEIIKKIATDEPRMVRRMFEADCLYCGANLDAPEHRKLISVHETDCIWRLAKETLNL